jgi:phage tail sheath gpL-like
MAGSLYSGISQSLVLGGEYFTASSANLTQNLNSTVLILGDITTSAPLVPTLVTSVVAANTLYGASSTLAGMIATYIALDALSTVYAMPVTVTSGVPALAASLTAIGVMPIGYFVMPYSDVTSVGALDTFLNETTGRWNYTSQLLGLGILADLYAASTGVSTLISAGPATIDSKYITCLVVPNSTTTTQANVAAAYAGTIIPLLQATPGIPLNGNIIPIVAPVITDFPSFSVRNTLETAGLSTIQTNAAGQTVLADAVTLHTTNTLGAPDTGWAKFTAVNELEYVINAFMSLYPIYFLGKKIVTDPTLATAGTIFITTQNVRQIFINEYQVLASQGMVANVPAFANATSGCQVQNVGGGRFNIYVPITLVTGLEIVALNIQFVNS